MRTKSILFLCSMMLLFSACNGEYPELEEGMYAEFVTNKGTYVAELFYEAAPMTVASFVSLAEGTNEMVDEEYKGKKFYNGLKFHRVIPDFMIQGGDPTGTGTGGPGYQFPNEIVDTLRHDAPGILSMANSGPDTNASQFFITLKETPWLDGMHTVFGQVVRGQEVVDSIGLVETDAANKPVEDVVMQEVNIIKKGDEAENFDAAEVFEEELTSIEAEAEAEAQRLEEQKIANERKFEELKAEAKELESGLKVYFNEKAGGETPEEGDTVLVNYRGYLSNGTMFDSNIEEAALEGGVFNQKRKDQDGYRPMPVLYGPDAPMIPGFKEGIQQMSVGDQATLFIPAELGYGTRGAPPVIPPNSDIIFEVELVEIQE